MKKILERIPTDVKLEIVFTRKLQDSYFNSLAVPFKQKFKSIAKKAFFKINTSFAETKLEIIKGLPFIDTDNGFVIFFEINQNLKK